MEASTSLSSEQQWSARWRGRGDRGLSFDPEKPNHSDLHRLFTRVLPVDPNTRFLEVGSYPGSYLWYFHTYYRYQVTGLEYVEWCCEHSRELLEREGVPADILHADLFAYEPPTPKDRWDVVASFGFIEHFEDTVGVVRRHLALLKPDGLLVLVIPNHSGIYGRLLKVIDSDLHEQHNHMSYEDIVRALEVIGGTEFVAGGYQGRFGLWNTGLYTRAKRLGRWPYAAIRTPLWIAERLGRVLPNTKLLSPTAAIIVRKLR